MRARARLKLDLFRGREALDDLEPLLANARQAGDRASEVELLLRRSRGLYILSLDERGYAEKTRDSYEEAYALAKEIGDKKGILLTVGNIAPIHYYFGEFVKARSSGEEYLREARRQGLHRVIADASNFLGVLELTLGNVEVAEEHFRQSLAAFENAGDRDGVLRSLVELARLRGTQERFADAAEICQQVREEAESMNARDQLASVLRVEAEVKRVQGELEDALELAQKSLSYYF